MGRRILVNLTTDYILSKVSEEDIFAKYLCEVEFGTLLRNPMRNDKNPTASFYINNRGRIYFKDFSGFFCGDCFNIVERLYGLTFFQALLKIAGDFKLLDNVSTYNSKHFKLNKKEKLRTDIKVKIQPWTEVDKNYWKSFHLNSKILDKYNVSSVKTLWVDGQIKYTYKENDPAYVYYFSNEYYKIYFPFREDHRFITNTNSSIIQGFKQLPTEYDFIVITKSLKDIMVYNLLQIPAIAPQAEGNILSEKFIYNLRERFPIIVINYDFDYAGVKAANRLKKDNILLFFTNGRFNTINYGAKDIADYIKINGVEQTKELIKDLYNNYII